jgi:Cu-Zn family superoxide dismutase
LPYQPFALCRPLSTKRRRWCSGSRTTPRLAPRRSRYTNEGLRVTPQLTDLPPGDHGFHIHVNPNCGAANGPNGQPAAGMAAGGHYDPANTGKHLGPQGEGHKGDMPVLTVDANGKATKAVTAPHLTVADVKGRSIVIHAGGDNYSDQPAPLGGGGARIACGVAM